jgi:hypothetical protein
MYVGTITSYLLDYMVAWNAKLTEIILSDGTVAFASQYVLLWYTVNILHIC